MCIVFSKKETERKHEISVLPCKESQRANLYTLYLILWVILFKDFIRSDVPLITLYLILQTVSIGFNAKTLCVKTFEIGGIF